MANRFSGNVFNGRAILGRLCSLIYLDDLSSIGKATDTIFQRTAAVTGSSRSTGTSPLILKALQLETVSPVNFMGDGLTNYFVTLQSVHGGPASTGSISITFDSTGLSGTFSTVLDVFYDVRVGSLNGAIVNSSDVILTSTGNPWSTNPPAGALTINGVNRFLSGVNGDSSQDFWPGPFTQSGSGGYSQAVVASTVPEPSSLALWGIAGMIGLAAARWRHGRIA